MQHPALFCECHHQGPFCVFFLLLRRSSSFSQSIRIRTETRHYTFERRRFNNHPIRGGDWTFREADSLFPSGILERKQWYWKCFTDKRMRNCHFLAGMSGSCASFLSLEVCVRRNSSVCHKEGPSDTGNDNILVGWGRRRGVFLRPHHEIDEDSILGELPGHLHPRCTGIHGRGKLWGPGVFKAVAWRWIIIIISVGRIGSVMRKSSKAATPARS